MILKAGSLQLENVDYGSQFILRMQAVYVHELTGELTLVVRDLAGTAADLNAAFSDMLDGVMYLISSRPGEDTEADGGES